MGTLANIADPDQMQKTWHLIGSSLFALNPEIKVASLKMGMNLSHEPAQHKWDNS